MYDYDEDEWYDDDDYGYEDNDPEIWGQAYSCWLYKAKNGHLSFGEGILTQYEGEDWGEASGWDEWIYNLNELKDDAKARLVEIGKTMHPGEQADLNPYWYEDDDDEQDITPPCPTDESEVIQ